MVETLKKTHLIQLGWSIFNHLTLRIHHWPKFDTTKLHNPGLFRYCPLEYKMLHFAYLMLLYIMVLSNSRSSTNSSINSPTAKPPTVLAEGRWSATLTSSGCSSNFFTLLPSSARKIRVWSGRNYFNILDGGQHKGDSNNKNVSENQQKLLQLFI